MCLWGSADPALRRAMWWVQDPQPSALPACAGCGGERAAGWKCCAAACETECARAWVPDDGAVTFRALEPLQKHRCDNQREPVMTFPGRRGAWPARLLPLEEVFHDYY